MKIYLITRGQIERPRNNTSMVVSNRDSVVNNIIKPITQSGGTVCERFVGYYDDWKPGNTVSEYRQKHFEQYENVTLYDRGELIYYRDANGDMKGSRLADHICTLPHQSGLFLNSLIDVDYSGYDYLIIVRGDLEYKQHECWSRIDDIKADLILPWKELNKLPNQRVADTAHVITNPGVNAKRIYNALVNPENVVDLTKLNVNHDNNIHGYNVMKKEKRPIVFRRDKGYKVDLHNIGPWLISGEITIGYFIDTQKRIGCGGKHTPLHINHMKGK